jgi:hypothetical protein
VRAARWRTENDKACRPEASDVSRFLLRALVRLQDVETVIAQGIRIPIPATQDRLLPPWTRIACGLSAQTSLPPAGLEHGRTNSECQLGHLRRFEGELGKSR